MGQKPPILHAHVASLLLPLLLVGVRCQSGQAQPTRFQMNEEQNIVSDKALQGENLDGEKVCADQHIYVCANEVSPAGRLLALRGRRNSVALENIAHRPV